MFLQYVWRHECDRQFYEESGLIDRLCDSDVAKKIAYSCSNTKFSSPVFSNFSKSYSRI